MLIVLAGPIGSGKSTVAAALGARLAELGRAAAVVDLDDVTFMQHGTPDIPELWRRGAAATSALVRAWFDCGTQIVVAHGPFFESGGYERLDRALPRDVTTIHVLLECSVDVALSRVEADLTRGISRDPDFLRATHARFAEIGEQLPEPRLVFDTTRVDVPEIVRRIVDAISAGGAD